MGLDLFDSADQPQFRLDEEGGERALREILDAADEEEAAWQRLGACLPPPKGGAG